MIDEAAPVRIVLDVDGVLHPLRPSGHPLHASMESIIARNEREEALDAADPDDANKRVGEILPGEFTDECMRVLESVVRESGAKIILSSTWRETAPQRRAVDARLVAHGLPHVIDYTPQFSSLEGRAAEILAWASEQSPSCCWVAIDDRELSQLPNTHFVLTDPARGMTPTDGERVLELLRQQRQALVDQQEVL